MSILISRATGNWLTSSTWALVDSTSTLRSESGGSTVPISAGASARSSAFTPGAITIDAIAVSIQTKSASPSGTITVRLWNNTDSALVTNATCTINVSDLPGNSSGNATFDGGWVVFPFGTNVTLTAGKAYMVEVITSSGSQVNLWRDSTANNWARLLRTTTQQAPAAGDDVVVAGEHTGAGTGNSFTVTMNETATTVYGSNTTSTATPAVAVCKRGTLKFADGSAANPYLKAQGSVIVYNGGELDIGTVATPIPRDSTAILEFAPSADNQFGLYLRNGSVTSMRGLSRTSGKLVYMCRLIADVAASGIAPSTSTLSVDRDTGWKSGDMIVVASTTRTNSDCEVGTLTADAGASSMTVNNFTAASAGMAIPPTSNRGCLVGHSGTGNVAKTVTVTIASPGVFTCLAHGVLNGTAVTLTTTGTLPTGLATSTTYFVVNRTDDTFQLAATPGGSAINTSGSQSGTHTATFSMTQAEIILLTRNVQLRSNSRTNLTYVVICDGAQVDFDWAQFYSVGGSTGPSAVGMSILGSNAWNFSITNCSIHDTETFAFAMGMSTQTITRGIFSNNVIWNTGDSALVIGPNGGGITNSNWTVDGNTIIRTRSSPGIYVNAVNGTITNNGSIGNSSSGWQIQNPGTGTLTGTYSGNYSHSNSGSGINFNTAIPSGDFGLFSSWYNGDTGIFFNSRVTDFSITPISYGCVNECLLLNGSPSSITLNSPVFNNTSSFSTSHGLNMNANGAHFVTINGGDFSTANGIMTALTNDIRVGGGPEFRIVGGNVKLNGTNQVTFTSTPNMSDASYISIERLGKVSGTNKTWTANGTLTRDTTITNVAAQSLRMTPSNATKKLVSAYRGRGFVVPCDSGSRITPTVYIRKSASGDGAAYNGNQPRLLVRANPALGLNVDTVLATYSASTGSWNSLSIASPVATENGAWEFYIDCDGTAGWINVSDWSFA